MSFFVRHRVNLPLPQQPSIDMKENYKIMMVCELEHTLVSHKGNMNIAPKFRHDLIATIAYLSNYNLEHAFDL